MKKTILPAAIIALSLAFTSCGGGGSFESDVRKMADYRCKMQKLEAKDPTDEKAKKELEDLTKEMEEYGDKMRKKYESKKDDKDMEAKADKIMKEVMDKCK
ncbi:MAG: hypothetical protein NTW29_00950 [Bacteroidetes bacterium]|nr:hypothetical protein [Bacteroidota bacterium]